MRHVRVREIQRRGFHWSPTRDSEGVGKDSATRRVDNRSQQLAVDFGREKLLDVSNCLLNAGLIAKEGQLRNFL